MNDIDESRAPLLDHLLELRSRLLMSFAALAVAFAGCLYFARPIFAFLVHPLLKAGQTKIINTQIFGGFIVEMKIAFFAAVMIAFPVIANQLWQFVAPGLYRNERRALLPFLLATPALFLTGASLAYFVAIPLALKFLLGFQGDLGGVQQQALRHKGPPGATQHGAQQRCSPASASRSESYFLYRDVGALQLLRHARPAGAVPCQLARLCAQ